MNTPLEIADQLERIAGAGEDFVLQADGLADQWRAVGAGVETVEPILRFMEGHPEIDYGTPGPLVHFMEEFWGRGYDEEVLASIKRMPTPHTVWLLNRLINGARSDAERNTLIAAMEQARHSPRAGPETIQDLEDFLEFQGHNDQGHKPSKTG